MNKSELIDFLVKDFQNTDGKGLAAELIKLRAMLNGLEISDLELLKSQAEKQQLPDYKPTQIRFLK